MKSASSDRSTASAEIKSEAFVGQWRRLVSTTNWEKGRIISDWRGALEQSAAKPADFSDETWSRIVGGVTPQHVGRLRRVYDRFGTLHATFEGVFWSHFHAALDWDDAEMWLEGAVQNDWSVSHMRRQRWETLGGDEPRDEDVLLSEINEDLPALDGDRDSLTEIHGSLETVRGTSPSSESSTGDADNSAAKNPRNEDFESHSQQELGHDNSEDDSKVDASIRPFARLATLPDDLQEAFESFKLALLRHKVTQWRDVSRDHVLESLDALKQLAVAPTDS